MLILHFKRSLTMKSASKPFIPKEPGPSRNFRDKTFSLFFLVPSLLFVGTVVVYPFFTGLIYSLKNGNLFKQGDFIGLANFIKVFQMPEFWAAMRFSLIFALMGVLGSYLLGLSLALLLNSDIPCRSFFRAAILIPWIIPSIVSLVSWKWLLGDQQSIINLLLGRVGIQPIMFLADPTWAIISVGVVKIWRSFPFMMISLLAVLQTVPQDQYESAHIDGANRFQSFRYITWPNLVPITIICGILMTIWSVNDFDTIFLLTNGGPFDVTQNIIVMAYKYAFTKNDIGLSSAMAIIIMVILMFMSNSVLKRQNEQV